MTNLNLNRKVVADVKRVRNGEAVWLEVSPDGLASEVIECSPEEAKRLAERLLKASGVKFTLSI